MILAKKLLLLVFVGAAFYGALLGFLYLAQERLMFAATPLPDDYRFTFDVPFEELSVPVDGASLSALHFRQPDPDGLVFFLHGNAGSLDTWTSGIEYYAEVNYDLFIFDYRGYGKSTGKIASETELHADVRAAFDLVAPLYTDKPIVIYGRSLGAALATRLAVDVESALVVLVSPFESMLKMAAEQYPFVPSALLRYPFRNDRFITKIDAPVILVHGDQDELIPLAHSERLQALTDGRAELLRIDGAGHNDIHTFETYLRGLATALPRGNN
ncbi:MAG: alpha/beta fold hydrolase [Pseudomonadota bacterium]